MSTPGFKVQLVRYCIQCEEVLPRRCTKCVKHPKRAPRVVELFGVPVVLAINECGCVKIRCQLTGCFRTMWRHPLADGTLPRRNHFCSPTCVRIATAAAKRAARTSTICSMPGCARVITRPASNMRAKHVYCSQKCHFLHRAFLKAKARRERAEGDDSVQAFACYGPRCAGEITDHTKLPSGQYDCVRCHTRAPLPSAKLEGVR